ncbi:MAG: hypothetical protein ACOCYT_03215 [Chloroflexota bacterium]
MPRAANRRQTLLGIALFFLMFSVYLLTYRGHPMSGDEVFIFDSMESIANRATLNRTYEFFRVGLQSYPSGIQSTPWPPPLQEPLASVTGVPLFWLAQAIPGAGTMHIVWLFNLVITALIGVSVYAISLWRGAPPWAAFLAGLMFGLGTIAWFYGRLLFREPLMALWVLWAFALADYLRGYWLRGEGARRMPWLPLLALAGVIAAALLTKVVMVLLIPPLVLLLAPPWSSLRRHWRRYVGVVAAIATIVLLLFILMQDTDIWRRYNPAQIDLLQNANWAFVLESVLGYQVGVSRSIWLYAPVLIAGLGGAALLIRQGTWRIVAAPLLGVLIFSVWYGIALRLDWSGGWGWGPRYMLPLMPVMCLWLPPLLVWIAERRQQVAAGAVALLFAAGSFIQLLGMANPLSNYYTDLFRADLIYDYTDYVEAEWHWMAGNWQVEWSPIVYHLERSRLASLDVAWRVADPGAPVVLLVLLGIGVHGGAAWWLLRRRDAPGRAPMILYLAGATGLALVTIIIGLWSLRDDPRYIQQWDDVRALVEQLDPLVDSDDVVFIDREQYNPIFMNYFKTPALVAALPYSPGEDYGSGEPVVAASAPIEAQIGGLTTYALDWSENRFDTLWFISSASPFDPVRRHPIERYLAAQYFAVDALTVSERARAVRFIPVDMPENRLTPDMTLGDSLRLSEASVPQADMLQPGTSLPVSLVWEPAAPLPFDYNVGLYLVGPDGAVYAQRDSAPQATFGRMSDWEVGQTYRDNHGLVLPDPLPRGDYQLLVAVYDWRDGTRLTTADGGDAIPLTTFTVP